MAARPRTLPAAIAPVLVGTRRRGRGRRATSASAAFVAALVGSVFIQIGTNLANDYSDARRGADTADRLGPVRVTSAGLVAPRRVLVATWVAFGVAVAAGHLPGDRGRGGDPARRRRLDPRRRPLHRRPAPLRLRGPRRAVRVPVLRPGRRQRLLLRPARASSTGCRSGSRSRSASWPPRSWWSTTSATSKPTGAPASGRSRCGSDASEPAASTRRWSPAPSSRCRSTVLATDGPAWALLALARRAARPAPAARRCMTRTDGPVAERRPRRHRRAAGRLQRSCSRPGS